MAPRGPRWGDTNVRKYARKNEKNTEWAKYRSIPSETTKIQVRPGVRIWRRGTGRIRRARMSVEMKYRFFSSFVK